MAILRASPLAKQVRTDMRQRVQKVVVDYNQERAAGPRSAATM